MTVETERVDSQDIIAERRTWTIEETAEILGISRQRAYEAARNGDIPAIRMGRRLLVPRVALNAMLARPAATVAGDSAAAE